MKIYSIHDPEFIPYGKAPFEVFKSLGVQDIDCTQPKALPYPTENPFA